MEPLDDITLPFTSRTGEVLAQLVLTSTREPRKDMAEMAPIIRVTPEEAQQYGETTAQLKEAERYEYEIIASKEGRDFRLRCDRATRWKSLKQKREDAGLLETANFCGTLLLELVEGETTNEKPPIANVLIDVRSLKLGYRDQYRGMLRRLSNELAALIVDCRSSSKIRFRSTFNEQEQSLGWYQVQLELLRETLDSQDFGSALQRILNYPHERLTDDLQRVRSDKPIHWRPSAVKQLAHGHPRTGLPEGHPLRQRTGMEGIASHVYTRQRIRDLDTPENRFIKHAMLDVRAFLSRAALRFSSTNGWQASAALATRLGNTIDNLLGHSFFQVLGPMNFSPLGSPVLQRRAGYRELLHWWLRFHSAAELSWEGGEEIFKAGQRNVADLYEYWLFFELLDWFCETCRDSERPSIEHLIEPGDKPGLKLKKRVTLGPIEGQFSGQNRRLQIRFSYNQKFKFKRGRSEQGSWTRNMHPDYTLTCWPVGFEEEEAERLELIVHVHLDAKYRVNDLGKLFGNDGDDDADEPDTSGNYKHQDLLKMHAYRDAIKRSQGAYVLYPGNVQSPIRFEGFHEILPGLGAFAISPDKDGKATGTTELHKFLNEVLSHLGNRTTALERSNYHIARSYRANSSNAPEEYRVEYGSILLPEKDHFEPNRPALPPAEHRVLVVCSKDNQELDAWIDNEIAYVRLGKCTDSLAINEELFGLRHLLIRRSGNVLFSLKRFTRDGFKIWSGKEINAKFGKLKKSEDNIYAVFHVEDDPAFQNTSWDEAGIWKNIEAKINREGKPLSPRRSTAPVVLTLRELVNQTLPDTH
jgi:predicted component of viral defense system (DUF524 family)